MKIKIILLLLIITSCKDNTPKTYKIPYTVLTDQIYTRLPGKLLLDKNYLIWQDPFISKDFIKIINTQSGEQVGEAGIIGRTKGCAVRGKCCRYRGNTGKYCGKMEGFGTGNCRCL